MGYNLDEKSGLFGMFGAKTPSKVLKKDDKIDFKHYGSVDLLKAAALDVTDTSIKIQVVEKLPETGFAAGDPVVVTFSSSQEMYVIGGEIESVSSSEPSQVSVKVVKIEKMKDSRKSERYFVSYSGDIKAIGISDNIFSIVKNISLGGIKINCKVDIQMEEFIDIVIKVDKSNKITFKGRVVRKNRLKDCYEYGIEITEIPESSSKVLHSVLNNFEMGA